MESTKKVLSMNPVKNVKLSVIVPAYNEEKTIAQILTVLLHQKNIYEILVVNDASKDKTEQRAKSVHDKRIRVFSHKTNKGKGGAILTGLAEAKGNYILIQDADMEYNPREIATLLAPIQEGRAEVVYGSRFYGAHTNMFYWHYLGNKFLNFVVNILYNTTLSDMETCYKVVPTQMLRELNLQETDFRIEPEMTCKMIKRGVRILEVPISYMGRTYEEGKKITWVDGIKALQTILYNRVMG